MMQRRKPLVRRKGLKAVAGQTRTAAPEAERRLWAVLRDHRIAGMRFQRQQPVGPYVADFTCPGAKLVIEIERERSEEDGEARAAWFAVQGYRVLHIPQWQALRDPQAVLDEIARMFELRAVPNSIPPAREG